MAEVLADEWEHVRDLMPEGAVAIQRFRAVAWINPETGETEFEVDWSADCPLTTSVGILEVLKHSLLTFADNDEEEDD